MRNKYTIIPMLLQFQVAWIKSDSKAILGIHTHMVSLNPRLSVTHNGHNTWKLHISRVQINDSGSYMCQVNTDPMKSLVSACLSHLFPKRLTVSLRVSYPSPYLRAGKTILCGHVFLRVCTLLDTFPFIRVQNNNCAVCILLMFLFSVWIFRCCCSTRYYEPPRQ